MLEAGINFIKIDDETLEPIYTILKEGYLFYIDYIKGDESKVELSIICLFDKDTVERFLTETEGDGKIVKWHRYLDESINTVYPIRLPGKCTKFRLRVNFIGGTTGNIKIGCAANSFRVE